MENLLFLGVPILKHIRVYAFSSRYDLIIKMAVDRFLLLNVLSRQHLWKMNQLSNNLSRINAV